MNTTQNVIFLICKLDQTANKWAYNRYCNGCAKFLHPEELKDGKCKKCHKPVEHAILKPIPIISSATAMEKVLAWLSSGDKYETLLEDIADIFSSWIMNGGDPVKMRLMVAVMIEKHLSLQGSNSGL